MFLWLWLALSFFAAAVSRARLEVGCSVSVKYRLPSPGKAFALYPRMLRGGAIKTSLTLDGQRILSAGYGSMALLGLP